MARVSNPDFCRCCWEVMDPTLAVEGTDPAPAVLHTRRQPPPSMGDTVFLTRKAQLVAPEQALPGRTERPFALSEKHLVLGTPLVTDATNIPEGYEVATFGLGCFWGAEEIFWQVPGVWSTSVGYAG